MVLEKIFGAFAFTSGGNGGTAFEMITVIVLTVLIAYVVGLMISHIVDRKLGDIEIQIPEIRVDSPQQHVNPPQIVFRVSEDAEGKININPLNTKIPSLLGPNKTDTSKLKQPTPLTPLNKITHPNKIQSYEPFLSISFDEPQTDNVTDSVQTSSRLRSNAKGVYKNYTQPFIIDELDYPIAIETDVIPTEVKPRIGCTTDADCNVVNNNGDNVCKSDGTCHCMSGSGVFCALGVSNFRDPKDMTPDERKRFKLKYRNNMTLQDYKNWLMLYKGEIEKLRQHHRRNLLKLLRGGQLSDKDLPTIRLKPTGNAYDFFRNQYKGGKISVHFPSNDSPLVGSNYGKYNDFVSPENDSSNFVTGIVDMYKEAGKDEARALNYHLRPDTRIGTEEESVGDIYQRYQKDQHAYADLRKIAKNIKPSQIPQRQNKNLLTFNSRDLNVKVE